MSQQIVKLEFKSPLHIGLDEGGIGLEHTAYSIRSDSFFSALCNAYLTLFGNESLEKELLNDSSDLELTDLFPYIRNDFYVPTPLYPPDREEQAKQTYKITRKNRPSFILVENFLNYLNGKHDTLFHHDSNKAGELIHNVESEIIIQNVPHVAIKNVSDDEITPENPQGEYYHMSAVNFPEDSGLWGLIKTDNDDLLEKINTCIRFLGDEGIGGKRSWGCGQFELELINKNPLDRIIATNTYVFYLLSTMIPDSKTPTIGGNDYYELIPRRGYGYKNGIPTPIPKKEVYAFVAGSVFKEKTVGNARVDVSPNEDKTCYRFGKGFYIPIKVTEVKDEQ